MKLISLALKENFPKAEVLVTYIGKLWERIFLLICWSIQLNLLHLFVTLLIQTDVMSSLTAPIQPLSAAVKLNHWKKLSGAQKSFIIENRCIFQLNIPAIWIWNQKWICSLLLGEQEGELFSTMPVLCSSSQWSYFNKYHLSIIFNASKSNNITMSTFFLRWLARK